MSPSEKLDDDILRSLQEMITRTDEKIKSILEKHEHFTKTNEKFDQKNDEIKNRKCMKNPFPFSENDGLFFLFKQNIRINT